jgi:hypothetical protein
MNISIPGFVANPRHHASGAPYRGRVSFHQVQWTQTGADLLATFTLTAREIADAAEGRLLWTDQDVQRGIKPGLSSTPSRELPLADGYPDPNLYIFDVANADDIAMKLLSGSRLFLNPLVWNLRPGTFSAYWSAQKSELYLYSGRIYLPDSHHRQQGILKAVRVYDEDPSAYPDFSPDTQFKIELYFLSKEDEGNYFFDKNQRPKPTAKSKAYDLTTLDDLSVLAKLVASKSKALRGNINRVTDRLTRSNPQVLTLSTLRQMLAVVAPSDVLDDTEMDGMAEMAATFFDELAESRPELGQLALKERQAVREESLVDSAVMMFGYAYLIADFRGDVGRQGLERAVTIWRKRLERLSGEMMYGRWKGDFFSRENPLWRAVGVLKPTPNSSRLTVSNTGATRAEVGRILRRVLLSDHAPSNLQSLTRR